MKYTELINFCENVLNENNHRANAICYDGEMFSKEQDVRIGFNRNHEELYKKLLLFCAEHNGIVIRTNPATFETIVRVELH